MEEPGLSRKRLKRDMRTCHECRRRKVRCQSASENERSCIECARRGLVCSIQESESENTSGSSNSAEQRLERIEHLLERLVEERGLIVSPNHPTTSLSTSTDTDADPLDHSQLPETSLIDILFRNSLFSRLGSASDSLNGGAIEDRSSQRRQRDDIIKQTLVKLLPSQQDANIIFERTNAWLMGLGELPGATLELSGRNSCLSMTSVACENPLFIGKTLLYLALCMQQLPPNFHRSMLQLGSVESVADVYTSTVATLILADDDRSSKGMDNFPTGVNLLLGQEDAAGSEPFGLDAFWEDPSSDDNAKFQRRLCLICRDLSRRNLSDSDPGYTLVVSVDDALKKLENDMPQSWWGLSYPNQHLSPELSRHLDRFTCHMWFFQTVILNHLSYAYRAVEEIQYEYSNVRTLGASKALLHRYLVLRKLASAGVHCRVEDFSAFVASVTIILLHLQNLHFRSPVPSDQDHNADIALVQEVVVSMSLLAESSDREVVAKQAVQVLQKLMRICNDPSATAENLQLTIPYFGTISILWSESTGRSQEAHDQTNISGEMQNQEMDFRLPSHRDSLGLQLFFSNTYGTSNNENQLPTLDSEDHTFVFDSMWDADVLNWNT
ncbi:hypothetical protein B7463_g4237, partial [Scytalidium lignicola]